MKFNIIVADPPWGGWKDNLSMSDVKRGANANYNTMTIDQIKAIPVKSITSSDGALVAIWVPSSMLQQGLDVMKAWGFNHKQTYIWVKIKKDPLIDFKKWIKKYILKKPQLLYDKILYTGLVNDIIDSLKNLQPNDFYCFGMGRLFRQTHEICLLGTTNNKIYKLLQNKSQRSVNMAENLKHSAKPESLQDSLDLMFPSNSKCRKIELFSRRQKSGWICLGNESPMTLNEDINISVGKLSNIDDNYMSSIDKLVCDYKESNSQELFDLWQKL